MHSLNTNHQLTFYSNDKRTKQVLDYAITSRWLAKCTLDCRVRNGYIIASDHRCLIQCFATPLRRIDRHKAKVKTMETKKLRCDIDSLKQEEIQTSFLQKLHEIQQIQSTNEDQALKIVQNLEASMEVLPKKTAENAKSYPWDYDLDLKNLKEIRSIINRKENPNSFRKICKKIKSQVDRL